MSALYWFTFGGGRRYPGVLVMLFGALLLAITAIAVLNSNSLGLTVLIPAIVISVLLGWLGYKMPRGMSRGMLREQSAMPILAALEDPKPTARAIRPQDVLGQWRFYVDAAGSTVGIDLQAGGRYQQVTVGNSGKTIDGPGGEWTLDGPNLDLSAYRSATRDETNRVRWFFGDCQSDLILFVKDDHKTEKMLVSLREEKIAPAVAGFFASAASV
jgi:hypothetical protein